MKFDPAAPGPVPSPCISLCRMNTTLDAAFDPVPGGLCEGCLRSLDEIIAWGSASEAEKRAAWVRIIARRERLGETAP